MAPTPPPETITLKIKVPPGHLNLSSSADSNASSESFNLGSIPVSTRVGTLRQQIQTTIPSNPAPERQRLLYGGRALVDNEQTLADALNTKRDTTQTEYVVHLLIKGEGMNTAPHAHHQHSLSAGVGSSGLGPTGGRSVSPLGSVPAQQPPQRGLPGFPPHVLPSGIPGIPTNASSQQAHQRNDQANTSGTTDSGTQAHGPSLSTQHPPQGHRRPLSGQGFHVQGTGPNGQRFEIHQQTFNFPHAAPGAHPGQHMQMPFGFPHMPPMPPGVVQQFPGMMHGPHPPPPPQSAGQMPPFAQMPSIGQIPLRDLPRAGGPTALDRAREDIAAIHRLVDEQRNRDTTTSPEDSQRLDDLTQHIRNVNNYIDPFGGALNNAGVTSARNGTGSVGRQSAPPNTNASNASIARPAIPPLIPNIAAHQRHPGTNSSDVTAYLLSGPQGPHALLFSPEHGNFHGALPRTQLMPTPTTTLARAQQLHQQALQRTRQMLHPNEPQQPIVEGHAPQIPAGPAVAQRDAIANDGAVGLQQQQQDPLAPFQPILAHAWLLFRILIFAYFFLGANLGYTKPLILAGIGLVFWAVRMGVLGFGDQGREAMRRWWEGVVGVPPRRREGQGEGNEAANGANGELPGGPDAAAPHHGQQHQQQQQRGGMPTPEQLAQRLLNEQDARQRERRNWLREQIRPVERAIALFVATLWPGIGEGLVQEQRRAQAEAEAEAARAEVEVERRRREEEAQAESARAAEGNTEVDGKDEPEGNPGGGNAIATGVDVRDGEHGLVERRAAPASGSSEAAPPLAQTD